jgi:hypothetical protein
MITTIITIAAFSALFVLWGVLRPADLKGGCHDCSNAGDPSRCEKSCELMEDLFSEPHVGAKR